MNKVLSGFNSNLRWHKAALHSELRCWNRFLLEANLAFELQQLVHTLMSNQRSAWLPSPRFIGLVRPTWRLTKRSPFRLEQADKGQQVVVAGGLDPVLFTLHSGLRTWGRSACGRGWPGPCSWGRKMKMMLLVVRHLFLLASCYY